MAENPISDKLNRKALFIALSVNILIVLVCFFVFYPVFETNDDSGLIAIASGIRGTRDAHIVHTNYLAGKLLTALYAAVPAVQWWSVLQFVLLFISFVLVTYILIKDDTGIAKVLFVTAVVFFFAYEGYVRIQYTKTAGMIAASGLILLFYGLLRRKAKTAFIIAGILLAVFGSFYRIQAFASVTAVFLAMVIYAVLCYAKDFEKPKRRIVTAAVLGVILLTAVGGLRIYDRAQYKDPEWAAYLEFDKYRTEVIDYGVPDYEEHEEEYNAIGVDKSAYKLMKSWTFQDPEKFTADTFRQIAEFRDRKVVNVAFVKRFVRKFAKGLAGEASFLCFAIVLIAWLTAGRQRGRKWISLLIMGAAVLAINFYLYYAGRFMVRRVDVGIWFAASLILLYQTFADDADCSDGDGHMEAGKQKALPAVRKGVLVLLCVLTAATFIYIMPWQSGLRSAVKEKAAAAEVERGTIEQISSDKDHLYLTKVGVLKFSEAYGVMDEVPYRIADNIYPLGGWGAATPAYMSVLKRYGVGNPFRDMIGSDSIYLVDSKINDTLDYLRKWYKADAEAELVNTINGHKIYRIR